MPPRSSLFCSAAKLSDDDTDSDTSPATVPVTAASFRLFLCHLYFGSHYCYPPLLPKTDIDLEAADPRPVSLHFPAVTSLDWSNKSPQLRFATKERKFYQWDESPLTLAHYLDCPAVLKQCEAVMLTQVEWAEKVKQGGWLTDNCLRWLPYADRYSLQRWKQAFIEVIAADRELLQRERYQQAKQEWDRGLLIEIMEALVRSKQ